MRRSRSVCRRVLPWSVAPAVAGALLIAASRGHAAAANERIDRHALVTRHNPHVTAMDPWAPLSVGNGGFCFTADVTGLQTFYEHYRKSGIPLETQARWSWHSDPNPNGYTLADANRPFTAYGRTIGYPTDQGGPAGKWLRENPHSQPLPQLALDLARDNGAPLAAGDMHDISQTLDLWSGVVTSSYTIDGVPVRVTVACHPVEDTLAVRIESALLREGKLAVRLAVPRGYDIRTKNNPALDWSRPATHATRIRAKDDFGCTLEHERDGSTYQIGVNARPHRLKITSPRPHEFRLAAPDEAELEFAVTFARPGRAMEAPGAAAVWRAAPRHWTEFWQSGGAIDFSGSADPRARELEQRVVLSQYLTAIQFAGDFPPQESGLTNSTWYGKHHTEMVWWHAAHFALWGRDAFLARALDWYVQALPVARELAGSRDLQGARWAKMIGPDGRESPGGNPLIVWNQPHPIHLAELLYRNTPTAGTLARYRELVLDTAAAMVSMLHWDAARQRYHLGPPLWIAQEIYDPATSCNPTYELSYWIRGLAIAQQWRERLQLGRNPEWDRRIKRLAPLPRKDGRYVAVESTPDTWDNRDSRHDHPSFLMALGQLPGDGVDRAVMRRTLDAVLTSWDWETKIWGWDYPMVAMTAARLGEPRKAVDILLFTRGPNNHYTANGHCPQRGDLPVYLPANGALLAAVAMMAAGWDSAPAHVDGSDGVTPGNAPGFPRDGSWVVRSEGLHPLP